MYKSKGINLKLTGTNRWNCGNKLICIVNLPLVHGLRKKRKGREVIRFTDTDDSDVKYTWQSWVKQDLSVQPAQDANLVLTSSQFECKSLIQH